MHINPQDFDFDEGPTQSIYERHDELLSEAHTPEQCVQVIATHLSCTEKRSDRLLLLNGLNKIIKLLREEI